MVIVGLLSWWYGAGWRQRLFAVRDTLVNLYDYFSFELLLKTLFSPFRQISAGKVRGPLGVQFRAWIDRLVSRTIGAIVRSMVLVIGVVTVCLAVIWGIVRIIVWPLIPFAPIAGFVLAVSGWVPWSL